MDELHITDIYSGNIERHKKDDEARFSKETGFPSPARDHYEKRLSLDEHLIHRPAATFFVRVKGDGMNESGIFSEDILIVDRSIKPISNHIVVVLLDGTYTVKRLDKRKGTYYLCSGKKNAVDVAMTDDLDYEIWGVVTHAIHKYV